MIYTKKYLYYQKPKKNNKNYETCFIYDVLLRNCSFWCSYPSQISSSSGRRETLYEGCLEIFCHRTNIVNTIYNMYVPHKEWNTMEARLRSYISIRINCYIQTSQRHKRKIARVIHAILNKTKKLLFRSYK